MEDQIQELKDEILKLKEEIYLLNSINFNNIQKLKDEMKEEMEKLKEEINNNFMYKPKIKFIFEEISLGIKKLIEYYSNTLKEVIDNRGKSYILLITEGSHNLKFEFYPDENKYYIIKYYAPRYHKYEKKNNSVGIGPFDENEVIQICLDAIDFYNTDFYKKYIEKNL